MVWGYPGGCEYPRGAGHLGLVCLWGVCRGLRVSRGVWGYPG